MRLIFGVLSGILIFTSALACEQPPVKMPSQMSCAAVDCVLGSCPEDVNEFNARFENLDTLKPIMKYESEGEGSEPVKVIQSCDSDLVKISVNFEEQFDEFKTTKRDIKKLKKGRIGYLRAIRTMGFRFADGIHTDRIISMECLITD